MDGIKINHVELNRPRGSCSIDEETIRTRFEEQMASHGKRSIVPKMPSEITTTKKRTKRRTKPRVTKTVELRVRTIKCAGLIPQIDGECFTDRRGSLITQCQKKSLGRQHGRMRSLNLNTEKFRTKRRHDVQGCGSKILSEADARRTKESKNSSIESETRHFRNQRWKRSQFNFNV